MGHTALSHTQSHFVSNTTFLLNKEDKEAISDRREIPYLQVNKYQISTLV